MHLKRYLARFFVLPAVLCGAGVPSFAQQLYWTDVVNNTIHRSNLNGSGVVTLISTGLDRPDGITIDPVGGKIYWAEQGGSIQRANLDGSGVELLIQAKNDVPRDVALNTTEGKLYWVLPTIGLIQRADLDGTNVETVVSVPGSTEYIALLRMPSPPLPALDRFGAIALIGVVLACGAVATRRLRHRAPAGV